MLQRHASGAGMGGNGAVQPLEEQTMQIESQCPGGPVEGGYLINGTLPWVSNLVLTTTAARLQAVVDADGAASQREVMFPLRCDAPGREMRECPSFSAMEGTGTCMHWGSRPFHRHGRHHGRPYALSSRASARRL